MHHKETLHTGLQLRNCEQNCFHANFLISQVNPMMWPSLKLSLRDDSNEWWHHRVWLRNKKVSILKTIKFRRYLLPWLHDIMSHLHGNWQHCVSKLPSNPFQPGYQFISIFVQLQTGLSQDQVGPDLGSSLFASRTTLF